MSCPHLACKNRDKLCYKCYDESYLKLNEKKNNKKIVYRHDKANAEDSWKDLEQQVADKINNVPDIQEARRSRRSGGMWFETGDIVDSILHPECKERKGKELQGADKSMSIKKEWLTKAKSEVEGSGKIMCLPFRFKGDDTIYNIMEFDDLAGLVTFYKELLQENAILKAQIDTLRDSR